MRKTSLTYVPALALILAVSAHKSSMFGTSDYQKLANLLLSGQDYYGDIDYDERAFQDLMARRLPHTITTLVAGSSRTMQLGSDCFDAPSYNASVSGAMLSDVAAVIEQFRRGRTLKHVIIAADPWMLNAHEQAEAWNASPAVPNLIRLHAAPDWIRVQLRLGLPPHARDFAAAARALLDPYRELLDPATFQNAYQLKPASANPFRKQPDGSLTYPPSTQDAGVAAQAAAEAHIHQTYVGFDRVDPFLAQAFEALVADLKNNGTRVTLVLAPFHPVYAEQVRNILDMTEAYYRTLNLESKGSYTGVPAEAFIDGVHLKKAALRKLYGCPQP